MKVVYEASNAVEAHMILHLLEQQGLAGRIDGEYLQGGVGELPATGFVKVMVSESDHAAAKEIVDQWDAIQPEQEPVRVIHKPGNRTGTLALGLLTGILATYAYFRAPAETLGNDYNGDGFPEAKRILAADGSLIRQASDRNFDGNADLVIHYDRRSIPESAESDDDFDGVFESRMTYRMGNPHQTETDTDGDGYRELRTNFMHGVPASVEYLFPDTGLAEKIDYYKFGKRRSSERDTDKDGTMDKRTTYNRLGDILDVENIP